MCLFAFIPSVSLPLPNICARNGVDEKLKNGFCPVFFTLQQILLYCSTLKRVMSVSSHGGIVQCWSCRLNSLRCFSVNGDIRRSAAIMDIYGLPPFGSPLWSYEEKMCSIESA